MTLSKRAHYLPVRPIKPSYSSEHRRMKPVMDLARKLDVALNPAPDALYEAGSAGFQIWCTPQDNPGGEWKQVQMTKGAFVKPVEYLASVHWRWDDESIIGLELSTTAYALANRFPEKYSASPVAKRLGKQAIHNREDDVRWAIEKTRLLFEKAGVPMPEVFLDREP